MQGSRKRGPFRLSVSEFADSKKSIPSGPHCVYVHTLSNIHDQFDVGIVVVVRSTRNLGEPNQLAIFELLLKSLD